MKKYFVTATGTDIGKSFFLCRYIRQKLAEQKTIKAIKPIITGLDFTDRKSDSALILDALGRDLSKENILNISPFFYETALSADIAARSEGKPYLNFDDIVNFCQSFLAQEDSDCALIEGVGGIMAPINQNKLILDLIKALDIEIILISGSYLGTISHSLTAIEVCKTHNVKIHKVIINDQIGDEDAVEQHLLSIKSFYDGDIEKLL